MDQLESIKSDIRIIEENKRAFPLLGMIPVIGALAPVMDSVASECMKKNIEKFAEFITESGVIITEEQVKDVEFVMMAKKIMDSVSRLSNNKKIKYFANLFINGLCIADQVDTDIINEFFYTLEHLSNREIEVLVLIDSFPIDISRSEFFRELESKCNLSEKEFKTLENRLTHTGFIYENRHIDDIKRLGISTTEYFKEFKKWVIAKHLSN